MITQFFKVPHGQVPTAKIRLNQRMGDKDEYRLDIESTAPTGHENPMQGGICQCAACLRPME